MRRDKKNSHSNPVAGNWDLQFLSSAPPSKKLLQSPCVLIFWNLPILLSSELSIFPPLSLRWSVLLSWDPKFFQSEAYRIIFPLCVKFHSQISIAKCQKSMNESAAMQILVVAFCSWVNPRVRAILAAHMAEIESTLKLLLLFSLTTFPAPLT